uniref:Uncharacterized protein n=1 Tax=Arundo donax TaxID=35708 RepID=A0A0A8XXL4_ARUDO
MSKIPSLSEIEWSQWSNLTGFMLEHVQQSLCRFHAS